MQVIEAVERVNEQQKGIVFEKLQTALGDLRGKVVAIWGLAFKPETDDMREAPATVVIGRLLDAGAEVRPTTPWRCPKAAAGWPTCRSATPRRCTRPPKASTLWPSTEWKSCACPTGHSCARRCGATRSSTAATFSTSRGRSGGIPLLRHRKIKNRPRKRAGSLSDHSIGTTVT